MLMPQLAWSYHDTSRLVIEQEKVNGNFHCVHLTLEQIPVLIEKLQAAYAAEVQAREKRAKREAGRRNIELAASVPHNRVHVVKAVRDHTGLPLAEAIDVVDALYKK